MKFSRSERVSLTRIVELRPPKNGRSYLMIDNTSGSDIKWQTGTIPGDFHGSLLPSGSREEMIENVPQDNIYIRGSISTEQEIQITENQKNSPIKPKSFIERFLS